MVLHRLRPVGRRLVGPLIGPARAVGLGPDAVTMAAVSLAALAAIFLSSGRPTAYAAGAAAVVASGLLDVLDGELARETGATSRRGDLLDHTSDRYADLLVVGGLTVATGRFAVGLAAVSGVLLTSYAGTECQAAGHDALLTGALCRADRLAAVVAAALLAAVGVGGAAVGALWLLAVGGHLVAVGRTARALRR